MPQTENHYENINVGNQDKSRIKIEKFLSRYAYKTRMNALEDTSNILYYGSIKVFETLAMSKRMKINTEDLTRSGYTHFIIFSVCSEV